MSPRAVSGLKYQLRLLAEFHSSDNPIAEFHECMLRGYIAAMWDQGVITDFDRDLLFDIIDAQSAVTE